MRVLIIGGTVFLGRHLVDAALARGDHVTLLHRGRHPTHRPAEVQEVIGDRSTDLGLLTGRGFDTVIDTCGYLPADVRLSAGAVDSPHYVFVSSASVYADTRQVPLTEESALQEPPDPAETDVHGELYGPQKVGCEQALLAVRPTGALILRAGLLVGPHDPTDRFTYWALRMRRPGPVLAPDVPEQPVQFLDTRDLAGWILPAAERRVTGVLNANGPRRALTFAEFLALSGPDRPEIRWLAEDVLLDAGVQAWSELPIWLPDRFGCPGLMDMDVGRIEALGLTVRPTAETVADVVAWADRDPVRVAADYGTRARSRVLTAAREQELLARYG